MGTQATPHDDVPAEIGFSKGTRGKLFKPGTAVNLPRMPEQDQAAIRVLLDAVIVKNQVAGAIERVARQPVAPAPVKVETKARRTQAGGARR